MKLRKINQLAINRCEIKKSNLYLQYQSQFEYFLNPDVGHKSVDEMNRYYVSDKETIASLRNILTEPMDSITALIGYQGIGKSTDIRYSYQITNNAIRFEKKNNVIIFPSFFNGFVPGKLSEDRSELINDVREELSKRIASVCDAVEEEFAELKEKFYSEQGQNAFYDFMKYTNPKAMVRWDSKNQETKADKLYNAKIGDYYIYIVTKLKYFLTSDLCPYNRILIILDNAESLAHHFYEEQLILQYLRFYTCMRNMPNIGTKRKTYINLLISIRPSTYSLLKKAQNVSAYSITREIYKTESVDLSKYFAKKYALLPKELNKEVWNVAYNILISLSDKFEKKYSNMIKRLVYMDMREALKLYNNILANPVWITKTTGSDNQQEEYIFNNITVIRALSCGTNLIYTNHSDNIIPNVLYSTIDKNLSILSLYIIAYFITQQAGFCKYGETMVTREELIRDFCDVFGEEEQLKEEIHEIINYLHCRRILSVSIYDEQAEDSAYLYLSSKGEELWSMLSADSVLMELYREDYYQDYDQYNGINFSSSYELMNENKQLLIFGEIYKILKALFHDETEMVRKCVQNGAYHKYMSIFGDIFMTEHLMTGVDRSIEYSGNKNNEYILTRSNELKAMIDDLKRVYTNEQ